MSENSVSKPAWYADLGDGTYRNPILYADYSDPDVIRHGDDFYMTASSFSSTPGLPILHSKDLVNWAIIGHAVKELPAGYENVRHGDGVWAPSIRFHNGKFWIFFGAPDEGLFMTTATDPAGPWTPLHLVKAVKGLIDPCPFWDEDGQAYLVHAFAKSRCGIKSKLAICRMKPDGTALLDEGRIVFDGTESHPTIEGPKLYKRNGYYYIFAPAGGVSTGWQTVLRSRDIYGPYEDRIVLHQGDSDVNGPHQGGYVELESGESWFVHFQDREAYGRIVHLQPMRWEDDWPVMGVDTNGDGIGEPVAVYRKPDVGRTYPFSVPATSDEFDSDTLGLQWQWQTSHRPDWYSLRARPGHLRLYARPLPHGASTLYDARHIVSQKFPAPAFAATAKLEFAPAAAGERAGLTVFGREYRYVALESRQDEMRLLFVAGQGDKESTTEKETAAIALPASTGTVYLRVEVVPEARCTFAYSFDGIAYVPFGEPFDAAAGHWVGAKLGMFCLSPTQAQTAAGGYVDIDWFRIE